MEGNDVTSIEKNILLLEDCDRGVLDYPGPDLRGFELSASLG